MRAVLTGLLRLFYISTVLAKRHVIRSTPKLRQQGYSADIDVGEVIAEAPAYSRENCVALCQAAPVCHSVMLVGQLCRMFAPCPCFPELIHVAGSSRYLVGEDASVNSFTSAMDKCLSLGAHSVHINSQEEHDMIKDYIKNSGVICKNVWTGGRSRLAGSSDMGDWRWYYTNDFTAASEPFTYLAFADGQPNNAWGTQVYMALQGGSDYDFNDLHGVMTKSSSTTCFLCECP